MGYTHYWTQTRDLTAGEWAGIQHAATAISGLAGVPLEVSYDSYALYINGVGDDAYEDFVLTSDVSDESEFCKTARKPYDVVVTAMLCYIATLDGAYTISSDGGTEAFAAGLDLARRALPFLAVVLRTPDLTA